MPRPRKEKAEKCIRQNISVEPEQLQMMLEYCQKEDRSISWLIRKAVKEYLCKVA